jgi:hypothetical protein
MLIRRPISDSFISPAILFPVSACVCVRLDVISFVRIVRDWCPLVKKVQRAHMANHIQVSNYSTGRFVVRLFIDKTLELIAVNPVVD